MSLTTWIVSYWKLDENSWTTAFDSVGSTDWTLEGSAWFTAWKINSWVQSPDSTNNAYVNLWTHPVLSWNFSVSIWVKKTWSNSIRWYPYFAWGNNFDNFFSFTTNSSNDYWIRIRTSTTLDQTLISSINTWQWYHLVATRDWNNLKWYVDWNLNINVTNSIVWVTLSNQQFYFLWHKSFSDNQNFIWVIDEVWVWNKVLTQAEITELYNSWNGLQYPFDTQKPAWFLMRNF